MQKVWAARNQRGEIIFVGTGTEEACETLKTTIGDFELIDELKKHPEVYSLEVAKPIIESVVIEKREIEEGVFLSHSEYIVFSMLSKEMGKLVSRYHLMRELQIFSCVEPERLTLLVSRLRKKIKRIGYSIFCAYGEGYILSK